MWYTDSIHVSVSSHKELKSKIAGFKKLLDNDCEYDFSITLEGYIQAQYSDHTPFELNVIEFTITNDCKGFIYGMDENFVPFTKDMRYKTLTIKRQNKYDRRKEA